MDKDRTRGIRRHYTAKYRYRRRKTGPKWDSIRCWCIYEYHKYACKRCKRMIDRLRGIEVKLHGRQYETMKSVNELLFEAFVAGFYESGEGYNQEYLNGESTSKEHIAEVLKPKFDAWAKENEQ